ncbi:hypothetical protein TRFO_02363 [Tritrichomonas foetus]|uniref:Rab-GAP TBC domain-containing protein n=1 Tax=Tritrichomonas foetus TaxID=1144522 RepID=A0A1J4J569_9EUKA|nr:hypothetical protein TRFO_02363 [Tritrichomonas foetus]|eukprot:OHS93841.1 hypothetical protein TRFO_02363 [Tritrichomonas foetus]
MYCKFFIQQIFLFYDRILILEKGIVKSVNKKRFMNSQDATFIVTYVDDQSKDRRGTLKVQHTNGNITFSFYGSDKHPLPTIPDNVCNLSDFTVFDISTKNPLSISFSGPNSQTQFSFIKTDDKTRFMEFIGTKVRVIHSDLNPSLFLLESIDFGESAFCTTILPNATSFKQPKRISLENYKNFTSKRDLELVHITKDCFHTDKLYNANIDDNVLFDAIKSLLTRERTSDDASYDQVKKQWKSIIPRQFSNHKNLQDLIRRLEADVNAHESLFSKYENPKRIMKIAFNVLLSYSIYNWDGALYYDGLIDLLFPFIDAFITQHGSSFDDETCESEIFTVFDVFYEENSFSELKKPAKQGFIKIILPEVGKKLENVFTELLNLLYQKHVHSLDFLRDDLSRWFVDVFNTVDIQRLWISILAFKNLQEFFESFLIALLFFVSPELNELNPLSFEEFVERFNEVKKGADLKTLLDNTLQIHEMIRDSPPPAEQ